MASPGESQAKRRVERLREHIAGPPEKRIDGISDVDRDAIIEFDKRLVEDREDSARCGWKHHRNLLSHLRDFAVETDGLAQSLDEDNGRRGKKKLTRYIHRNYDNQYSVQAKLSTIRIFAQTVLDVDELPKRFAEIEPGEHVTNDPAPLPEQVIEYGELIQMITSVNLLRDKALLSTQWDGGLRPMEELYPLQRKQLTINDDHIIITLPRTNGKTERRQILITVGMPYLKAWLRNHPAWDDPEVPVDPETDTIEDLPPELYIWTDSRKNSLLSYGGFGERFRAAGDAAGIGKETSGQHFRRSSASIMARQAEIGERDLRMIYDWSYFSSSPEHYIAAHSEGVLVNVAMARDHEVKDVEEDPEVSPIPCEQCLDWTMRGVNECVHCGYNLDVEQETLGTRPIEHPEADDMRIHEKVIKGHVTADDLESVEKVQSDIRAMGQKFFDQLSDLKRHAEAAQNNGMKTYGGLAGFAGAVVGAGMGATERAAAAWARAKHEGMKRSPEFAYYPEMPVHRQVGLGVGLGLLLTVALGTMYTSGTFQELAAGDPLAWIPVLLGAVYTVWLFDRELPSAEL